MNTVRSERVLWKIRLWLAAVDFAYLVPRLIAVRPCGDQG